MELSQGNQFGRRVVFDIEKQVVVIYDKHKIRTYFKPIDGEDSYWEQFRKDVLNNGI